MQIELANEFAREQDSILIVAIAGNKAALLDQLYKLYMQVAKEKPAQGTSLGGNYTTQIITPVWEGKNY